MIYTVTFKGERHTVCAESLKQALLQFRDQKMRERHDEARALALLRAHDYRPQGRDT